MNCIFQRASGKCEVSSIFTIGSDIKRWNSKLDSHRHVYGKENAVGHELQNEGLEDLRNEEKVREREAKQHRGKKKKQLRDKRFTRCSTEINDLPDAVLCHILSFLPTKDSVRSSVLSKRWRNLWLQVPTFDLDSLQFDHDLFSFRDFVDRFLESDENLALSSFTLMCYYEDIDDNDDDDSLLESWIDSLVRRRVRHLDFQVNSDDNELIFMPISLYSCTTLASLSLYHVALSNITLELAVALPCLKVMRLDRVRYDSDESNLEMLIPSCPVLEKLTVIRDPFELLRIMRVRSESLKSLTLGIDDFEPGLLEGDHVVEIDAPRLEVMSLCDRLSGSIVIHSIAPCASVNIDVYFQGEDGLDLDDDDDDDDDFKRTMIRNFLTKISTVSRMEISSFTLLVLHDYSKLEPLPQFSNLTLLNASFVDSFWKFLPTLLGCCPNLHTLVLGFEFDKEATRIKLSSVPPPCFVSSLKYVELATPGPAKTLNQMELASFFLRNCSVVKKLTLSGRFGDDIIKKIKRIPRRSRRCIIVTC